MNLAEWNACADSWEMLKLLGRDPCPRRIRLFGCACYRRIWDRITLQVSRQALLAIEEYPQIEGPPGVVRSHPVAGERDIAVNSCSKCPELVKIERGR
jgi:hypothetical protein